MALRDCDDVRRQEGRWDSDTHPNQRSSYGQGSSGWGSPWDPDYQQWREEQMRSLDSAAGAGSATTTKHQ